MNESIEEEKVINYLVADMLLSAYNHNSKDLEENELNDKIIEVYKELFPKADEKFIIENDEQSSPTCLLGEYAFKDNVSIYRKASKIVAELLELDFVEQQVLDGDVSVKNVDKNTYIFMLNDASLDSKVGVEEYNRAIHKKLLIFSKCGAGSFIFDKDLNQEMSSSKDNVLLYLAFNKTYSGNKFNSLYVGLSNYQKMRNDRVKFLSVKDDFNSFKENIKTYYDDDFGVIEFLEDNIHIFNENSYSQDGHTKSSAQKWKEVIDYGVTLKKKFGSIEGGEIDFKNKIRDVFDPPIAGSMIISDSFISFFEHKISVQEKQSNGDLNSSISQRIQNILSKRKSQKKNNNLK